MAKKALPKKLYAKIETDGTAGISFVVADDDPANLVDMGQRVVIGTYQLVETAAAEGTVSMGPKRKPR